MRTQISAQFGCKLSHICIWKQSCNHFPLTCPTRPTQKLLLMKLSKERARPHVREPKEKSRAPQGQELKGHVTTQNQPAPVASDWQHPLCLASSSDPTLVSRAKLWGGCPSPQGPQAHRHYSLVPGLCSMCPNLTCLGLPHITSTASPFWDFA